MFESICITRQTQDGPGPVIDAGLLAEAMVFYQKVSVIGEQAVLADLVAACGPDTLVTLLEDGHLTLLYQPTMGAVATVDSGTRQERHTVCTVARAESDLQDVAANLFLTATGKEGRSRRLARRLVAHAQQQPYDADILEAARSDIRDAPYLEEAASAVLSSLAPAYQLPVPIRFSVTEDSGYFQVESNIDFAAANEVYHRVVPASHSSLSPADILVKLVGTREHLALAAAESAELVVSPTCSMLVGLRTDSLINAVDASREQLTRFQEMAFSDANAIREAVSGGEQTIADLLPVLEKARKWKKWLAKQPDNANLVHEYYKSTVSGTWLNRLPSKVLRWSIFQAAGLAIDLVGGGGVGTAAGIALSAADAVVIQRLVSGWKPHQFVEGYLQTLASHSTPTSPRTGSNHGRTTIEG